MATRVSSGQSQAASVVEFVVVVVVEVVVEFVVGVGDTVEVREVDTVEFAVSVVFVRDISLEAADVGGSCVHFSSS